MLPAHVQVRVWLRLALRAGCVDVCLVLQVRAGGSVLPRLAGRGQLEVRARSTALSARLCTHGRREKLAEQFQSLASEPDVAAAGAGGARALCQRRRVIVRMRWFGAGAAALAVPDNRMLRLLQQVARARALAASCTPDGPRGGRAWPTKWSSGATRPSLSPRSLRTCSALLPCAASNAAGSFQVAGRLRERGASERLPDVVSRCVRPAPGPVGRAASGAAGHSAAVKCLDFVGEQGRCIVSGGSDNALRLWETESGACLGILNGRRAAAPCARAASFWRAGRQGTRRACGPLPPVDRAASWRARLRMHP